MIWQKYKHIIIAFGLTGMLSLLIMFIATDYYYPSSANKPLQYQEKKDLTEKKQDVLLVAQKYYTLCGHFEEKEKALYPAMEQLPLEEFKKKYSAEDGWILSKTSDMIVFSLPVNELCPADRVKRHLSFKDGYVAVYQGLVNSSGPLLRITSIKKENLPDDWKRKIANNQVDFSNEQELLQALDSLDDYY